MLKLFSEPAFIISVGFALIFLACMWISWPRYMRQSPESWAPFGVACFGFLIFGSISFSMVVN